MSKIFTKIFGGGFLFLISCLNIDSLKMDPCDPNRPDYDASGCSSVKDSGDNPADVDAGTEDAQDLDGETGPDSSANLILQDETLLDPSSYEYHFGSVSLTYYSEHQFILKNAGSQAATGIMVDPADIGRPFVFVGGSCLLQNGSLIFIDALSPNAACTFSVGVEPATHGYYNSALFISYNGLSSPSLATLSLNLRVNGTGIWTSYDNSPDGLMQNGTYPAIIADNEGFPTVAWQSFCDYLSPCKVFAKRWNGAQWVEIGPHSASNRGISNSDDDAEWPALAIDKNRNKIFVAWQNSLASEKYRIYLKWSDNLDWYAYSWAGGLLSSASGDGIFTSLPDSDSKFPSVAVDPNGNPIIAWTYYYESPARIHIRQYNPETTLPWTNIAIGAGVPFNGSGSSEFPRVAAYQAKVVVAWQLSDSQDHRYVMVNQWENGEWHPFGNSTDPTGISGENSKAVRPSLALNNDGFPVVAWGDVFETHQVIYLKAWNGSEWLELDGSASRFGISGESENLMLSPVLALDQLGYPIVAWVAQNYSDSQYTVMIKRYNGVTWIEVGAGSATNGIASKVTFADYPALTLYQNKYPILTWMAGSGEPTTKIFVKYWKWDGLPDE